MNEVIPKIKNALAKIKHKELLIAVILIVILFLLYFSGKNSLFSFFSSDATFEESEQTEYGYCEKMTLDVTEAVKLLTNSDQCKVIINWSDDGESVIAYTTTVNSGGESKTPQLVTVNGVSSPIVLKETHPVAVSVAVVCPKNTSTETKLNIKYLISTLLQADINNIAIYSC